MERFAPLRERRGDSAEPVGAAAAGERMARGAARRHGGADGDHAPVPHARRGVARAGGAAAGAAGRLARAAAPGSSPAVSWPSLAPRSRVRAMSSATRIPTTHVGSLPRPAGGRRPRLRPGPRRGRGPRRVRARHRRRGARPGPASGRRGHRLGLRRRDEQDRLRHLHPPPAERVRAGGRAAGHARRPGRLPGVSRPPGARGRLPVPAPDLPRPDRLRAPRAGPARPRAPDGGHRRPAGGRRVHERAVARDRRAVCRPTSTTGRSTSTSTRSARR